MIDYTLFAVIALLGTMAVWHLLRRERRFRQAEARIGAISESSPIGLFTTDVAGGIVSANPACAATLGLPGPAILGRRVLRRAPSR